MVLSVPILKHFRVPRASVLGQKCLRVGSMGPEQTAPEQPKVFWLVCTLQIGTRKNRIIW